MPPKPKPVKQKKKKKKNARRGICVRCGYIYTTTEDHYDWCNIKYDSHTIAFNKSNSDRKLLDAALNYVVKEIVIERDKGCVCPPPQNGHNDVLQPGHIITRGAKSVKWDLYNVHCQCKSCNILHENRAEIYINWFSKKFGSEELEKLVARGSKASLLAPYEMSEMLEQLNLILVKQKLSPAWKPYFTQEEILSGSWENEATSKG